jgi:predicted transcriptional regulator
MTMQAPIPTLKVRSKDIRLLHIAALALAAGEEPSTRMRVFQQVQQHPGLHQRDIARRLDMRPGHAEYHLRQLEKTGLLRTEKSGGYKRYYLTVEPLNGPQDDHVPPADRAWLAVLREARPLELVAQLLQESPLTIGEVANRMDLAVSTTSYHVTKLEKAGILQRHREGNQRFVSLSDRERLIQVLLRYEPPDDLVEGFEDLWDDIGL